MAENQLEMTFHQKELFTKALQLSKKTISLTKDLKDKTYPSKDAMLQEFSSIWSIYEEIFSVMKSLLTDSKGELRNFFSNCHEQYLNEYKLLRGDMSSLLLKNEAKVPMLGENGENSFSLLLDRIISFESTSGDMLSSTTDDQIVFFFLELGKRHKALLSFIHQIFEMAESSQNYHFYLSKNIRITNLVLTIIDKNGIKDWNRDYSEYEKLSLELGSVLHKLNICMTSQQAGAKNNAGMLIYTFRECVEKLANFSKSETSLSLDSRNKEILESLFRDKEENAVIDFFSSMVTSTEVSYVSYTQNKFLKILKNCCTTIQKIIEVVEVNLSVLHKNHYELAFLYQFVKRFYFRIFVAEMYKRLVLFNKMKRRLMIE